MIDILIINGYRSNRPALPVGIGYLAQAVEDAGFQYQVCDVNLQSNDEIVQKVHDNNPRFVGCGTMSYEVSMNYHLLQKIRALMPEVTVVLGGPHAIAAHREIFAECDAVDIVVEGEGEESIVSLLQGTETTMIPGVLTRSSPDGAIPRRLLDIDKVAFPKYNQFDLEKYGDTVYLASSRGCVYECSFCGAPKFLGRKWRAFTVRRIIEEFNYWYARGYRKFYFSDSLFVLDKQRVVEFCRYIVDSGFDDVVFTADGLRADHLTLEILQYLKTANFKLIVLGVESVNEETLKFFRKGETFTQIDHALSMADSLGFDIAIYLVIGAPGESPADAVRTIKYPIKYRNIVASIVSKLLPIKGTPYYEYAVEHGLTDDACGYYPEMEVYGTNERRKSQNPVEEIWEKVLPEIERMSKFLSVRNLVKMRLSQLGLGGIGIRKLNLLTRIAMIPVVFGATSACLQLADRFCLHRGGIDRQEAV